MSGWNPNIWVPLGLTYIAAVLEEEGHDVTIIDMNAEKVSSKFNPHVEAEGLRGKLGIAEDDKVIVYVGTLFEFSGLDLYLKQFPAVLKEFPKAKLVIVGGGALLEKLKELVVGLKITGNVILTDFQPFDMMPQYINLADICINPFIVNMTTRDIIPGKVIQYLACAKPVLATPLPGMVSLLPSSERGVAYSSINEFAENTIKLLRGTKATRDIGENGYRYVKDSHDERKIAYWLETILGQMIAHQVQKQKMMHVDCLEYFMPHIFTQLWNWN
jgi:glycosyltransferase involved in cell wall biosynthesis